MLAFIKPKLSHLSVVFILKLTHTAKSVGQLTNEYQQFGKNCTENVLLDLFVGCLASSNNDISFMMMSDKFAIQTNFFLSDMKTFARV